VSEEFWRWTCRKQGPGLSSSSTLRTIDVSRCEIGDEGALALLEALQNSTAYWGKELPAKARTAAQREHA